MAKEIPEEYQWIKANVKVRNKTGGTYTAEQRPYLFDFGHFKDWVCAVEEVDELFLCKNLEPDTETILLDLSVEQARDLLDWVKENQDAHLYGASLAAVRTQLENELG